MLGRYNLTPANRKGVKAEVYEFSAGFYGNMSALMGAGIVIELERFMESQLTAEAGLRFGYDARMSAGAELNAEANGRMMVEKKAAYTAEMAANMQRAIDDPHRGEGALEADFVMISDAYPGGELYGEVAALWNSVQIKETVMRFEDLVIPPGSAVVIDSEFFTATMDDKNIVDLYEGDWIELSHRLLALEARGISSGDLDVSMLYREMYL